MQETLRAEGLDYNNVSTWEGRPKRAVKRTLTYWEEFVQTDDWYREKLVEDVPEDELFAALEDSDFEGEEGEEDADIPSDDDEEDAGSNAACTESISCDSGEEEESI